MKNIDNESQNQIKLICSSYSPRSSHDFYKLAKPGKKGVCELVFSVRSKKYYENLNAMIVITKSEWYNNLYKMTILKGIIWRDESEEKQVRKSGKNNEYVFGEVVN